MFHQTFQISQDEIFQIHLNFICSHFSANPVGNVGANVKVAVELLRDSIWREVAR